VLIRTPGPWRAFNERVRVRRGLQIALVATARPGAALLEVIFLTNGGAANPVHGPTSSRRFTAQSGPAVLSYCLTVMTSCSL
jgi:hypothetical protein